MQKWLTDFIIQLGFADDTLSVIITSRTIFIRELKYTVRNSQFNVIVNRAENESTISSV